MKPVLWSKFENINFRQMKAKEKISSGPGYFQDLTANLHDLRNCENFTDLVFMCSDGPVYCHKVNTTKKNKI